MALAHIMIVLVSVNGSSPRVFIPPVEYPTHHACDDYARVATQDPENIEMIRIALGLVPSDRITDLTIVCQPGWLDWIV